jgi:general secretion pathway protein H
VACGVRHAAAWDCREAGLLTSPCQSGVDGRRCGRTRGFSLIEILVVLVIVGVLALAIGIGVNAAGGERQLMREGERVQALVVHACERAELGGREIGMRIDAGGYAFSMLGLEGWMADESVGELRPRQWVQGLRVELRRDDRVLAAAGESAARPQIVCFPSGELSPFTLRLGIGDVPGTLDIDGFADGRVDLARRRPAP